MSVVDNLNLINQYKGDIKQAIVDKGVDMTDTPLSGYASKIGEIQTGSDPVTEELTVTGNGTYTPGEGVDGYSKVTVEVPQDVEGYTLKDVLETGIQESYLYDASITSVRSYVMPYNSNVKTINFPNVTSIGTQAFANCSSLISLDLPNATAIGTQAFFSCKSLESVNIPKVRSIYGEAFSGCSSLISLDLPNLSSTGGYVFYSCRSLQSVNMPILSSIGNNMFGYCSSLESVNIPNANIISNDAFGNCSKLSNIDLPNVFSISNQAFYNCKSLSSINVGINYYSVATLGTGVFTSTPMMNSTYLGYFGSIYVPAALESEYKTATNWVNIKDRIVGVGDPSDIILKVVDNSLIGRFSGSLSKSDCTRLKLTSTSALYNIDLPNVMGISSYTFSNYGQLLSIDLPNLTYIGSQAFYSCRSLQNVNMLNITSIGDYAFSTCSSLQNVNIPNVTSIGSGVFQRCYSLQSIDLPNVTSLYYAAFANCSSLQTISLPNVDWIDTYVFAECISLESIYVGMNKSDVVYLMATTAFQSTPIDKSTYLGYFGSIYVPASLVDAYKTARYWSYYKDRIVGI